MATRIQKKKCSANNHWHKAKQKSKQFSDWIRMLDRAHEQRKANTITN